VRGYFSPCTDENCIVKRSARSIAALVVFVILADLSLLAAALYP
jgi:hypothetical protein